MAATSSFQAPRRKKVVYGKLSRPGYSAASFFDDEDELTTSEPTVTRPTVKSSYKVQKSQARAQTPKPIAAKQRDTFDIPSSEDEVEEHAAVVPRLSYKPKLVDDRQQSQLPPWEQRRAEATQQKRSNATNKLRNVGSSPDTQLRRELAGAMHSLEAGTMDSTEYDQVPTVPSPGTATSPGHSIEGLHATSAAACLASRKRLNDSYISPNASQSQEGPGPSKQKGSTAETSEGTPRKRVRREHEDATVAVDTPMADLSSPSPVQLSMKSGKSAVQENASIFDFPDTITEEMAPRTMLQRKVGLKHLRRGKPTTYQRVTHQKGVSAPARLADMIATDSDTADAPTRSPSVSTSRMSTPHRPATPPSAIGSPGTAVRAIGSVTPKQANLWNSLLPSDPAAPSPSALLIKDLSISGSRGASGSSSPCKLVKSHSDVGRRRTRLVDRLKASTMDSDSDFSDEDKTSDPDVDIDVTDRIVLDPTCHAAQAPKLPRQISYSQSQSQNANTFTGPKVTYSSMRSYLPEDDAEADLMLGLDVDTPHQNANTKRTIFDQTQKSAFDLAESDDEGPGQMRSIHELRASGINARGMGDIEELLDDVEKHKMNQRGARRTAIVNLATKLMDKSFKSRFVGQGYEVRLASECATDSDDIADFLLTSCVALLLDSEPPEHVVRSFRDSNIAIWLVKHASNGTPVLKLAKERKNNMSKLAQTAMLEMTEKLRVHTPLWHDSAPPVLTPRLIALRALDLLVRALRRVGDRSEIMDGGQMETILLQAGEATTPGHQLDLAMSMSILESLSTSVVLLDGQENVVEKLSAILLRLDTASAMSRDTLFLTLRLCLNLTNDNTRNCKLLSQSNDGSTTSYLLQSVQRGFGDLGNEEDTDKKSIVLDLLVLAIGVMINLTEHVNEARIQAISTPELLDSLISIFQFGQRHMLEAESEEESVANVTFGYLAVMLANICQHDAGRAFIASKLPGKSLRMLVEAVEEFVAHHQKVDNMNFEGEEGAEVWSGFTERLKTVLKRLKDAAAMDG